MTTKKPKIIGIVGGSGSGKTTVTKRIIDELTIDKVALIEQDYYYKDQSHMTMDERVKTNYDHPSAFDNELLLGIVINEAFSPKFSERVEKTAEL